MKWILAATWVLATATVSMAQTRGGGAEPAQTVVSGPARTALLELYTSEGCSSCPPAEAWLGNLSKNPRAWKDVVPVAFHVDYWDYLGWQDMFAQPAFSERQRDYSEAWKSDRVYTPGFVLNGSEWRGWLDNRPFPAPAGDAGRLALELSKGAAAVRFEPAKPVKGALDAHIALLGMGLTRKIAAGENKGKALTHDFVVLDYQRVALAAERGAWSGHGHWSAPKGPAPAAYAVAVWVTAGAGVEPIQAAGAPLNADAASALQISMTNGGVSMKKITKTDDEWRDVLTPDEYRVTRLKGTEPAFSGRYWDNHDKGIYLCAACGQPLFSSESKFESGTGWPSFYQPIESGSVDEESDRTLGMTRIEVLCSRCDSHLGHVFDDGPKPTGLRYCMNSAALKFMPENANAPDATKDAKK